MMIRVAINGFGRIGRNILRAGINDPEIEFVAINDLTDNFTLAYLLKYDSVHRKFEGEIQRDSNSITVNGKRIPVYAEKDPKKLPWKKIKVDVVAECTGLFRTRKKAQLHLDSGAKKVLVSAPCKCQAGICLDATEIKVLVKGVNEHTYDYKKSDVISNASCTTNCAAPIIKVINDNLGIKNAFLTTVHGYTATQKLVDGPNKDPRRGRAAAMNIVPTTTGAAKAVVESIPELQGKLDGMAIRVPVINGSITDFSIELKKETTEKEINKLFKSVSKNELKGVIEYTEEPLVSTDILGNPHSAIFDSAFTKVMDGTFLKCLAWYDNEWGYSNRMVDMIKIVAKK